MSEPFAVAIAQFAPDLAVDRNLVRIADFARTARERGASILVLPEYAQAFTPELGAWMHDVAEPADGTFATQLAEIAREHEIAIVAGMLETAADGHPFNTLLAMGATGERVAIARKLHLYDAFGTTESDWLQAGPIEALPPTFTLNGMRFGLQTCYDLRFPEVSRRLVDGGADAIIVPAEWVRGPLKEYHWQTLLRARAIENTAYVIAADQDAPVAVGHSTVIDPRGVQIATIGVGEGVAVAWLDAAEIAAVRRTNPALRLRRFDVTAR